MNIVDVKTAEEAKLFVGKKISYILEARRVNGEILGCQLNESCQPSWLLYIPKIAGHEGSPLTVGKPRGTKHNWWACPELFVFRDNIKKPSQIEEDMIFEVVCSDCSMKRDGSCMDRNFRHKELVAKEARIQQKQIRIFWKSSVCGIHQIERCPLEQCNLATSTREEIENKYWTQRLRELEIAREDQVKHFDDLIAQARSHLKIIPPKESKIRFLDYED